MPARWKSVLKLEVPVVVQIGRRSMRMAELLGIVPGAIMELPKAADEDLEVLINNKQIGTGKAVKIGENFAVQVTYVGDMALRVKAMSAASAGAGPGNGGDGAATPAPGGDSNLDAAAEKMIAGQT